MPEFVHQMTLEQLATWCALLAVGATWAGVIFVKPFLRLLVGGEPNVNDTISYATGVFTLFYGLLVGLLTVAAYQARDRVEQGAFREATTLGRLYSDAAAYPEPLRSDLRGLMRDYVLYAIHKDWPAHAEGRALTGGDHREQAMRFTLARFEPRTPAQDVLHREVMRGFADFADARQARLSGVLTRLPLVLWYAVGVGALITVVLLVMLKMRPLPHLVLGGVTSFFLGVMLFVILALDDPLRGAGAVGPTALERLWETRMVFDEPMGRPGDG